MKLLCVKVSYVTLLYVKFVCVVIVCERWYVTKLCVCEVVCEVIVCESIVCEIIIEGSLEVKLPTIWRDEKQSRAEAPRRGRLEERRSEEKE